MTLDEWIMRWGINDIAAAELRSVFSAPMAPGVRDITADRSESGIQSHLRVIASRIGATLWRNNSGAVTTDDDRHVRFGLGNDSAKLNKVFKSSDLIGITVVQSTAPGQRFGVFTAIECKKPGWSYRGDERETAQNRFHEIVRAHHGLAGFAQSPGDYERILRNERS